MAKAKAKKSTKKAPAAKPPVQTRVSQSALARQQAAHIQVATKAVGLAKPLTAAQRRALIAGSNVSDDFLEKACQASDALGKTSGADGFDSNAVRTAIAFKKSQGPVVAAAQALLRAAEDQTLAQYGGAGTSALDFYAQLKVKARRAADGSDVKTWLKTLSDSYAAHRQEANARNTAAKAANQAKRAEKKALKAATAAVKKGTKPAAAQPATSTPAKSNGGAQATN